jgi:iron transport multicopper oxidase
MTGGHLFYQLALALIIYHRFHYPSPSLLKPGDDFPKLDATLINGKGQYPGEKLVDLAVINVEYGKRYRLRIVSISCDAWYTLSFDDHPLTVIEADAESVVPVRQIDALKIFAGNHHLKFDCVY